MSTEAEWERFREPGGTQHGIQGALLTSAATIAPTHKIHTITGTAEVTTITVPYTGFAGTITLIPDGAFTFATGGNVAAAYTAVANRAVHVTYVPSAALWYVHDSD
jgi:hypothetical protein